MRVVFRADASVELGTGHIMRCLTLADALKAKGARVFFICREWPGHLCNFIMKKGYSVYRLSESSITSNIALAEWEIDAIQTGAILSNGESVDWLVVDNYSLDRKWGNLVRSYTQNLMVIDDLADRPHDCELLLDQNFYENLEDRYKKLVPVECQTLLGPSYALLRTEFTEARSQLKVRDSSISKILIFFGGSDPGNQTSKALQAIKLLKRPDISVTVVVGSTNPYKDQVKVLCSGLSNVTYYCQISNMAKLMSNVDLAIGAMGSTAWERCSLCLPSIVISVAKNQIETAKAANKAGVITYLGDEAQVGADDIYQALVAAISSPKKIKQMGSLAGQLVNSNGVKTVVHNMFGLVKD